MPTGKLLPRRRGRLTEHQRQQHLGGRLPDTLLHARTGSLAWFARQRAHQPFDFEILDPTGLRDALSEQTARLHRLAERK